MGDMGFEKVTRGDWEGMKEVVKRSGLVGQIGRE
jgi:hypothetical protein